MINRKNNLIVFIILLMAIGFASVVTSLYINGGVLLFASNLDGDIYFSDVNGGEYSTISQDGKNIHFITNDLFEINDKSIIDYEVTNNSKNYSASVDIECNTQNNEYIDIYNSLSNVINPLSVANGKVIITLKKKTTIVRNIEISCTLNFTPIEINENDISISNDNIDLLDNSFSGIVRMNDGHNNINTLSDGNLVFFSDNHLVSEINDKGRFYVSGLENGTHEVFYMGDVDPTNMTKEEIMESSIASTTFTLIPSVTEIVLDCNEGKCPNGEKYIVEDTNITKGLSTTLITGPEFHHLVYNNYNLIPLLKFKKGILPDNGIVVDLNGHAKIVREDENTASVIYDTDYLYLNKNSSQMFNLMIKVEGLEELRTDNVENFDSAFNSYGYYSTSNDDIKLDLRSWNVSNVKTANYMFSNLGYRLNNSITEINISGWNMPKLTSAANMFQYVGYSNNVGIINIYANNLNVPNLVDGSYMFYNINRNGNEAHIELSNFYPKVGNYYMFFNNFCGNGNKASITINNAEINDSSGKLDSFISANGAMEPAADFTINLNNFKTNTPSKMFYHLGNSSSNSNVEFNITDFDISEATDLSSMFSYSHDIQDVSFLANVTNSKATTLDSMFYGCERVKEIDLSGFDTRNVTNTYGMFCNTYKLDKIYVSDKWNMSKVTSSNWMFHDSKLAVSYDIYDASIANYNTGVLTYKE